MPSSTPIIIDALIASPDVTAEERSTLANLRQQPSLTWSQRRFVLRLVKRILKGM